MSVSASAENLTTDARSCDGGSMCLELALEGERLCKAGDCRAGVAFFQAAIQAGTDDLRTLSAIYSQLGNAYFYLGDYNKAMQYHKHDLTLARRMEDKLGEAKASGNLGNTLKVMGKFSEAIQCCKRHLELARALGDRLSEGRALYNLGNVYHAHGKQLGRVGQRDPGHFPQEVRDCLLQAVAYYEENLELMRQLEDRGGMGRACGNLGNTCYLLGEFSRAIRYHTERLRIARAAGDKPAERRANSNLANSHIFLGQFENAADHYKRTLALAEELGDAGVEAQACYSLGNTYTLLREYRAAEQYHARHLAAARALNDRVGEGRACWSLGNAHAALGNHEKALYYANEHLLISKELGDVLGMATAQMNISDLRGVLGLPAEDAPTAAGAPAPAAAPATPFNALRVRRQSMEQLSLIQITPDAKKLSDGGCSEGGVQSCESAEESFLELLTRCQSARLDDQRASLATAANKENRPKLLRANTTPNKHDSDELRGMRVCGVMKSDDTFRNSAPAAAPPANTAAGRAKPPAPAPVSSSGASLPGTASGHTTSNVPEIDFMDLLTRVQGSRIDDQRTELPPRQPPAPAPAPPVATPVPEPRATVASDKELFFDSLFTLQSSRMDDQRATIPLQDHRNRANNTYAAGAPAPSPGASRSARK